MAERNARVTGFVALGALALILVPMLFDGEGVRETELTVNLPPAPGFPVMEVATPQRPQLPDTRDLAPPRPEREAVRQLRMVAPDAADETVADDQPEPSVATPPSPSPAASSRPPLTTEREVPVLDQQGVPVAWTLQLAAFKERANAEALRDRLIKAGYKAYTRQKNSLTRVYIGPEVQRTELERLKLQLQRELKLDGLILRFTTG